MKNIEILIVDDEQFICDSLVLKFNRMENGTAYKPMCCNSGSKALMLMEENAFDVIITDIRMPFMTGSQFIKKARGKGFSGKIFALSGYEDFNNVHDAFVSGADDYLLKPISVAELKEKVIACVESMDLETISNEECMQKLEMNRDVMSYVKEYIASNYMNSSLSMDEVAKHVSISYSHFSCLFRKMTGTTFPDYLRKLRIEKAIKLLSDPEVKISEICYRVGYKYPQQLSKEFKRVTGVYPSIYVDNCKKFKA